MWVSLEDVAEQFGFDDIVDARWFRQTKPLLSLCSDISRLALASQNSLHIIPVYSETGSSLLQSAFKCPHVSAVNRVRSLHWVSIPTAGLHTTATYSILLAGTETGDLLVLNETGDCLLKQFVHRAPIRRIQVRYPGMGLSSTPTPSALAGGGEVTLTFSDAIAAFSLADLQRIASSPDSTDLPLPISKWRLPSAIKSRSDAVLYGRQPPDLYQILQSGTRVLDERTRPACLVTGGSFPSLATLSVDLHSPGGSVLALAGSLVGSVLRLPQAALQTAKAPWSLLPSWSAAAASAAVPQEVPFRSDTPSIVQVVRDDRREVQSLWPAPEGPLLAATDNRGRLLVLDGASSTVIRMWKGYRDVECCWIKWEARGEANHSSVHMPPSISAPHSAQTSTRSSHSASPHTGISTPPRCPGHSGLAGASGRSVPPPPGQHHRWPSGGGEGATSARSSHPGQASAASAHTHPDPAPASHLVLLVHAPRRHVVEAWLPRQGRRLAAKQVAQNSCLLQVHAAGSPPYVQPSSWRAYLLDAVTGTFEDLMSLLHPGTISAAC